MARPSIFCGPANFSQECGSHSAMLYLHSSTGADNDLGERFVRAFNAAAQDAGIPDDPEFRAALNAYMEWAVAEVLIYSPLGSVPPEGLPIPHWDWDGLVASAG
jgi:hemoglobin